MRLFCIILICIFSYLLFFQCISTCSSSSIAPLVLRRDAVHVCVIVVVVVVLSVLIVSLVLLIRRRGRCTIAALHAGTPVVLQLHLLVRYLPARGVVAGKEMIWLSYETLYSLFFLIIYDIYYGHDTQYFQQCILKPSSINPILNADPLYISICDKILHQFCPWWYCLTLLKSYKRFIWFCRESD